jgi:hypothetical protein
MDIISGQHHTNQSSVERDLWAAVLDRAVLDLAIPEERIKTLAWFRSHGNDIGSFVWICMILDLEPSRVRGMVLQRDNMRVAA